MPEITDLPTLPPKWHGADYSARQIAAIRERVADASFGPERPVVTWLLEEIDWLGQQVVGHGPAATQWAVGYNCPTGGARQAILPVRLRPAFPSPRRGAGRAFPCCC